MARPDLKKMKMPEAKKKPFEMSDEEMSIELESPEMENEEEGMAYQEESMAEEGSAELRDISDDDLLKEIERRGLSLEKASPKKMEELDLEAGQ